jgi:hypothetical protein
MWLGVNEAQSSVKCCCPFKEYRLVTRSLEAVLALIQDDGRTRSFTAKFFICCKNPVMSDRTRYCENKRSELLQTINALLEIVVQKEPSVSQLHRLRLH